MNPPLQTGPPTTAALSRSTVMTSSVVNSNAVMGNPGISVMNALGGGARSAQHQLKLLWSPLPGQSRFLIYGTDLRLCHFQSEHVMTSVAVHADLPLMRCCAWSSSKEASDLVAIGLTNGRAQLLKLEDDQWSTSNTVDGASSRQSIRVQQQLQNLSVSGQSNADLSLPAGCLGEFIPRNSRACNTLAFSPTNPSLLAVGLDKVRNDYCLLIWDTEIHARLTPMDPALFAGTTSGSAAVPAMQVIRPLQQYGSSEAISSLSWVDHQPHLIGAGMGLKWIRFYDLRQDASLGAPATVINTKAVHGLQTDPFHEYRLASYAEDGSIKIWDLRRPVEPVLNLSSESRFGIANIEFSPSQPGLLASLNRESDTLDVWRLQTSPAVHESYSKDNTLISNQPNSNSANNVMEKSSIVTTIDDIDVPVLWRSRRFRSNIADTLSSFTWIATEKNSIITISKLGLVDTIRLKNPSEVRWSAEGDLAVMDEDTCFTHSPLSVTDNASTLSTNQPDNQPTNNDSKSAAEDSALMEKIMKDRTKGGYGLSSEDNIQMLNSDPSHDNQALIEAWSWLFRSETLIDQGRTMLAHRDFSFYSMISLLQANLPTATTMADYSGFENSETLRKISNASLSGSSASVSAVRKGSGATTAAMAYTAAINTTTSFTPVVPLSGTNTSQSALGSSTESSRSYRNVLMEGIGSPNPLTPVQEENKWNMKITLTPQRILSLLMCGCTVGVENYEDFITKLETNGEYAKAAAWSLFHFNIQRCIKSLSSTLDDRYKVIITALSGFYAYMTHIQNNLQIAQLPHFSMWQDSCRDLMNDIKEPFIRALFAFVSSGGSFNAVLDEKTLPLHDRVAIAVRFLTDEELIPYLRKLTRKCVMLGEIEGLLLTGFSFPQSIDLLQQYLDRTGDIQTVALFINCCPSRRFKEAENGLTAAQKLHQWTEIYRDILDCWQFFYKRCRFDIDRRKRYQASQKIVIPPLPNSMNGKQHTTGHSGTSPSMSSAVDKVLQVSYLVPPQIYVRCNFCNQSIAHDSLFIPGVGLVGVGKESRMRHSQQPTSSALTSQLPANNSRLTDVHASNLAASSLPSTFASLTNSAGGSGYSSPRPLTLHPIESTSNTNTAHPLLTSGNAGTNTNNYLPNSNSTGMNNPALSHSLHPSTNSLHPSQRTKSTACPSCKKPLPRCSVCLLPMGTPLHVLPTESTLDDAPDSAHVDIANGDQPNDSTTAKSKEQDQIDSAMANWFAWCQRCRHGGHVLHLQQWFRHHQVCPVSECSCSCYNLFTKSGK